MTITILFVLRLITTIAQPPEKLLLNTDKQWYYPGESIWLSVNTFNACSNKLMQLSGVAYLELVGSDGTSVLRTKIKIDDAIGEGRMTINDDIPSGAYSLIAYTNWMKNTGQTSFCSKPVYIINPARIGVMNVKYPVTQGSEDTENSFRIQTTKQVYAKREPVAISFSLGKAARVAISAYKVDKLEKGANRVYMSHLDDPCSAIFAGPAKFNFENEGQLIVGRVTDKQTQLPVKGVRYYAASTGFPEMFSTAVSDSDGLIRFLAHELTGKNELIIQPAAPSENNYSIELMSSYVDSLDLKPEIGRVNVFEEDAETIDEAMVSAQVQNIFSSHEMPADVYDTVGKTVFYARPDAYYLISDYVHFNSVEEILREVVTTVNVRKRQGKLFPVVLNLYSKKPYQKPPLILVNGVPVFDVDGFMRMNTDDFYSISVKSRSYYVGGEMFYGILDVRLKSAYTDLPPNSQTVEFAGTQRKSAFTAPEYSDETKRAGRKPDFRNVLYWNPKIETPSGNGVIHFYTSDIEGEYIVAVQAITRDGQVMTSKTSIQVK